MGATLNGGVAQVADAGGPWGTDDARSYSGDQSNYRFLRGGPPAAGPGSGGDKLTLSGRSADDAALDKDSQQTQERDQLVRAQSKWAQIQAILNGGSGSGAGEISASAMYAAGFGAVRDTSPMPMPAPIQAGPEDFTPFTPSPIDFQPVDVQVGGAPMPLPGPALDPSPIGLNITTTDPFVRGFANFVHQNINAYDGVMGQFHGGVASQLHDESADYARQRNDFGLYASAIKETLVGGLLPSSQGEAMVDVVGGRVIGAAANKVLGVAGGALVSKFPVLGTDAGQAVKAWLQSGSGANPLDAMMERMGLGPAYVVPRGPSFGNVGGRATTNSAGEPVVRTLVQSQDELLQAAENAAGGSLDNFNNYKPNWWESPDGNRRIEWNPDGHANTNEGPHVTVRDFNGQRHVVTDKYFIDGWETYHP